MNLPLISRCKEVIEIKEIVEMMESKNLLHNFGVKSVNAQVKFEAESL